MSNISTNDLKVIINSNYEKLKYVTLIDEIFIELNIFFGREVPINYEGINVYSDNIGYHYVITERGIEKIHKITNDLFEISYWIYYELTLWMSNEYEFKTRINNQDSRKIIFAKQLELLNYIGYDFYKKAKNEIEEIIIKYPYNDNLIVVQR